MRPPSIYTEFVMCKGGTDQVTSCPGEDGGASTTA